MNAIKHLPRPPPTAIFNCSCELSRKVAAVEVPSEGGTFENESDVAGLTMITEWEGAEQQSKAQR
jgi:hypothetical protein